MSEAIKKICFLLAAITLATQTWAKVEGLHWFSYNGLYYRLLDNKVTVWDSESYKKLKTVTIPETVTYKKQIYKVTEIGWHAFRGCSDLTSITIPESVTSIDQDAFEGCTGLTKAEFTSIESLCRIRFNGGEANPLYYAHHLYIDGEEITDLEIPESVTSIGSCAFIGCNSLTSVIISESVTSIGSSAFSGCNSLTSITIPESVTSIGNYAFASCHNLTSIAITNSIMTIGEGAFNRCSSLTTVNIPNSISKIEASTFYGCEKLTNVILPNSVTEIGPSAFGKCAFETVDIPSSVIKIGRCAFVLCPNLKRVNIPMSVEYIFEYAFSGCPNLKGIYCYAQDKPFHWDNDWITDEFGNKSFNRKDIIKWGMVLFSDYAKVQVETELNEWLKKGEFEKVADWQRRVSNDTRNKKIKELTIKAEKEYIEKYADKETSYVLGTYDTENEVYLVTNAKYGKMLVPVPFNKAQNFKQQWEQTTKDAKYLIDNDTISIASIVFTLPNGEQYKYNSKVSLNYEVAQVNYNFAPIEIASPTSSDKGNQSITTTQRTIGLSDVDTDIPTSGAKSDNTFAVIIANENYQKEAQVPFAFNDGRTFAEYCKKTLGIPNNNVHIITDVTLNNMKYEVRWLKQVIDAYGGEARVIFYYAGHGIPDEAQKTAYLLPVDGFGNDVSTGYKLDDLYSTLGNLPSKSVTVFLDACFSGANRDGQMLASARGVAIKAKSSAPVGNMVVFSAAQGDETAYPNNEKQHGMFTYYLLKKIKETEGNVTYKDLGDYVTDNVRKQSIVVNGKSQTPVVVPSATVGGNWESWKLK